jgi:hypothetical protein
MEAGCGMRDTGRRLGTAADDGRRTGDGRGLKDAGGVYPQQGVAVERRRLRPPGIEIPVSVHESRLKPTQCNSKCNARIYRLAS